MANKYRKKCSKSLANMRRNEKTIKRYHYIPSLEMAKMKDTMRSNVRHRAIRTLIYFWWECKVAYSSLGKNKFHNFLKVKYDTCFIEKCIHECLQLFNLYSFKTRDIKTGVSHFIENSKRSGMLGQDNTS